jgi:2-polyprenyl-3-methyl-5-hydroxy-6-metoxy-1,4-benzoquinol methylase
MQYYCNNCEYQISDNDKAYKAKDTQRGLSVFVCSCCSLVQSLPRIDKVTQKVRAASGGADWGNIRYGKGFRADYAVSFIKEYKDLGKFKNVLDIGSNRGVFFQKFHQFNQSAQLVGVEPDISIKDCYKSLPFIELHIERIENMSFRENTFDLVHCSHTVEHLADPVEVLKKIWSSIKPDGLMFLEVPNLDFINNKDVVEEFFIDKHLYHYSAKCFEELLYITGYEILKKSFDTENLTYLVTPNNKIKDVNSINGFECDDSRDLVCKRISTYAENLELAEKYLNSVSKTILSYSPKKVVIWGAGRLFDLLFKYGELEAGSLHGLIDANLGDYISHAHDMPILPPSSLSKLQPDIVVIASRTYFAEIKKYILENSDVPVQIVGLMDLLEEVQNES